jgi:hypothetical protein
MLESRKDLVQVVMFPLPVAWEVVEVYVRWSEAKDRSTVAMLKL